MTANAANLEAGENLIGLMTENTANTANTANAANAANPKVRNAIKRKSAETHKTGHIRIIVERL